MNRIFLLTLVFAIAVFARPSIQVDKDRIESGKQFGLQLIFPLQELPENRSVPKLELQNGFTLVKLDSADQAMRPSMDDMDDMFSMFFGGGRPQRSYKARVYTYTLKAPRKTGRINIGTFSMEIDGQKHNISNDLVISLHRSYSDQALTATLKPSKTTIFEGEQISVSLSLYTYEHFGGNLQATDMNIGNDFIIHYGDLNKLEFKPVENSLRESQASAKYAWLSPTKEGKLQIPSFKFKYTKMGEPKVVEEKKQMGSMSFSSRSVKQETEEAEASTPVVNLTVKPLPTEGKPENFSGMVGNYTFKADIDSTKLKVGEALTLNISISGDGLPGSVTDPKLPNFEDFRSVPPETNITKKISGNKVITTKTTKVFLYPKKKGEFTIPEITYSWFDPAKKKYESASAGPWTIEVEKNDKAPEPIYQNPVAANGPVAVQKQEIEDLGKDIRFIHTAIKHENSQALYKSVLYWLIFLAAVPFYFIIIFTVKRKRKRNSDVALIRKGKASKMLKARFASASEALAKGNSKDFYAALENGLVDYLSDLTNLEFKGMTRPQMKQELSNLGIKEETISSIDSWLEKCAFARFAPVAPSSEEQRRMLSDVEKLCDSLGGLK